MVDDTTRVNDDRAGWRYRITFVLFRRVYGVSL